MSSYISSKTRNVIINPWPNLIYTMLVKSTSEDNFLVESVILFVTSRISDSICDLTSSMKIVLTLFILPGVQWRVIWPCVWRKRSGWYHVQVVWSSHQQELWILRHPGEIPDQRQCGEGDCTTERGESGRRGKQLILGKVKYSTADIVRMISDNFKGLT